MWNNLLKLLFPALFAPKLFILYADGGEGDSPSGPDDGGWSDTGSLGGNTGTGNDGWTGSYNGGYGPGFNDEGSPTFGSWSYSSDNGWSYSPGASLDSTSTTPVQAWAPMANLDVNTSAKNTGREGVDFESPDETNFGSGGFQSGAQWGGGLQGQLGDQAQAALSNYDWNSDAAMGHGVDAISAWYDQNAITHGYGLLGATQGWTQQNPGLTAAINTAIGFANPMAGAALNAGVGAINGNYGSLGGFLGGLAGGAPGAFAGSVLGNLASGRDAAVMNSVVNAALGMTGNHSLGSLAASQVGNRGSYESQIAGLVGNTVQNTALNSLWGELGITNTGTSLSDALGWGSSNNTPGDTAALGSAAQSSATLTDAASSYLNSLLSSSKPTTKVQLTRLY